MSAAGSLHKGVEKGDRKGSLGSKSFADTLDRKGSLGSKSFADTLASRQGQTLHDFYRIEPEVPEHVINWSVRAFLPRCPPAVSMQFRPCSANVCSDSCSPRVLGAQLNCFGYFDTSTNSLSKTIVRDPHVGEMDMWEIREALFMFHKDLRHGITGVYLLARVS
jgi:hypothetical protein